MADTKPTENKKEDTKPEEKQKEPTLYKLLKNVKYGNTPHKIGEKIEIKPEDLEEFKKARAISIE